MEFLGDAILSAIISDIIYKRFPNRREGFLTNTRSKMVQRETLNRVAVEIGLQKKVVYSAKISSHNNYMYGNALEALIGAIYLDKGYYVCYKFIEEKIIKKHIDLEKIARKEMNFKSSLIEWSQKNKMEVSFNLIEFFTDNDGNPIFQTEIMLFGEISIGIGIGYSKKESQQNAAKMAIRKLRKDKNFQTQISKKKEQLQKEQSSADSFNELPDEDEVPDDSIAEAHEEKEKNT